MSVIDSFLNSVLGKPHWPMVIIMEFVDMFGLGKQPKTKLILKSCLADFTHPLDLVYFSPQANVHLKSISTLSGG